MGDNGSGGADNPGVIAPPPLIFAGGLTVGLLLNRLRPMGFLPRRPRLVLGPALLVGGVLIGSLGFRELSRAGTNVDPYKPATAIVEQGPYRFTRNPLYVGLALMYGGISVLANALPAVAILAGVLHVVHHHVIKREERYLEQKFGEEYLRYKGRVRRWI